MKKIILIILSVFFINLTSSAQLYLGASSGVAITNFRVKEYSDKSNNPICKSLIGFNIDVPILFKLNNHLAIQSGFSYLNMGTKIDNHSPYHVIDQSDPIYQALLQDGDNKYRLNYLSLPITFNFTIPLNQYSVYARAGGYVSAFLYGTSKGTESNSKRTLNANNEQLNTLDLGGILGIGGTRNIGNGYMFFDTKYMLGVSQVNQSSSSYALPFGTHEIYNKGLFLNVGYMFNLGKSKE